MMDEDEDATLYQPHIRQPPEKVGLRTWAQLDLDD
jgi:hypothetical protein